MTDRVLAMIISFPRGCLNQSSYHEGFITSATYAPISNGLTPAIGVPYFTRNQESPSIQPIRNAVTTEIKVLSADAVEPGMVKVIASFQRETGHAVKVTFATAPAILKRIGDASIADVVIAPPGVLEEWVKAGK